MSEVPAIPPSEYRERQTRLADGLRRRGLDGILVWSTGGSSLDSYGNVFYLTNHYTQIPRVGVDIAPFMTGWGQTAFIGTGDGEGTLVVESTDWRQDLVVVDRVRHSGDLFGEVANALRDSGLAEATIGLAGASCLPLAAWRVIEERLPRAHFVAADDLLFEMRMVKSPAEIEMMRHASAVACEIHNAMLPLAEAGRTDNDLVRAGLAVCLDHGAVPWEFAFASGPASRHGYWCRLPAWDRERRYEPGDIIHPDVYGSVNGYFYDVQRTRVVGGEPSGRLRWLLDGVVGVVEALCAAARPGTPAAELARLRERWLDEYGYGGGGPARPDKAETPDELVACGHGVGVGFELPWIDPSSEDVLREGMTIALEVYLTDPDLGTVVNEEVVLVTEDVPEILTAGCAARGW